MRSSHSRSPADARENGGGSLNPPPTATKGKKMFQQHIADADSLNFPARPIRRAKALPAPSWAPASEAYVVMKGWTAGKRLILLTRGERHSYRIVTEPDTSTMSERELDGLAAKLNRRMGVPLAAAKALAVDWNNNYSTDPIPPRLMAGYLAGEKVCRAAHQGKHSGAACPATWLRVKTNLGYWSPDGWALSPTELRFAELAAHFEATIWAYAHGRRSIELMLPAERLAAEFTKAWQLLHGPSDEAYRRTYSRWFSKFYMETKNSSGLAQMQRENRAGRREALLALRRLRKPALRAYNKARWAYIAARPDVFAPGQANAI
jgi:hypothetical protein